MANEVDALQSAVKQLLVSNGSFYRAAPEDKSLYMLDLVVLGKLAYTIIEFAANVFGAFGPVIVGGRWVYKRYWKPDAPAHTAGDDKVAGPPALKTSPAELQARLQALRSNLQDEAVRTQLQGDVRELLEFHGWPAGESEKDARRIVAALGQPS